MKLYASATLKLALWYLLILMTVSLLFSVIIFQVAQSEIGTRLQGFTAQQIRSEEILQPIGPQQIDDITNNLLLSLGYLNLVVLLTGGAGAYLLAKWTLAPIERSHKAQSRFVSNASHQFRTPLTIMQAETELALSDPKTPKADLRQTLQSNLEEINHLTDISTMLLELSQTEDQRHLESEEFDIVKLSEDMIASRGVKDRTSTDFPETLSIALHQTATRELFAIVLDNAIKHSPKDSMIKIQIKQDKKQLIIKTTNHGTIKPKDLPNIFERFYQADNKPGSYGLGLSLAKQLATTLGGSISAKSSKNNTTFTISLPIA